MKTLTKYIFFFSLLLFGLTSCNDSFLDRSPTHDLNDASFWKTADDLKTYNNGIYNSAASDSYAFFQGYGASGYGSVQYAVNSREAQSDNAMSFASEHRGYINLAAGLQTLPVDAGDWKWDFLRRCNIFFANYNRAEILQSVKNNFAGEVYFWRAWFYLDKVQLFGDVPYITKPLDIDSPELYGARDPRKQVMDSVLSDINRAVKFLPDSWAASDQDRVTKWTALALKSRICLYEGTYRKYHNLGDHDKFLKEAVDAADQLIKSKKFKIYKTGKPESDLRTLFISESLKGNPEVIMPFVYATPVIGHGVSRYILATEYGITKDLVDDFLCLETDGTAKPIALSTVYKEDVYEQIFDNRDPRLVQTILDPRKENEIVGTNVGYPGFGGKGAIWQAPTGYHFIKFLDKDEVSKDLGKAIDDYPVIRYAEVLLNYAEAKAELGGLTQTDLDISINQLRDRVKMPNLNLNPPMDPKYKGEGLSALLVEIRRERRVELAGENFRYQDLMRWKQGAKLAKPYLGTRVEDKDLETGGRFAGAKVKRVTVDGKKYIDAFAGTNYATDKRSFNEVKDYLRPIGTKVIAKNPNIKQNPGWE